MVWGAVVASRATRGALPSDLVMASAVPRSAGVVIAACAVARGSRIFWDPARRLEKAIAFISVLAGSAVPARCGTDSKDMSVSGCATAGVPMIAVCDGMPVSAEVAMR